MTQHERMIRVFVSSTSEDLKDYRGAARHAILDMGWHPEMMPEHSGAIATRTVDACQEKLRRCDLVLLIVAWRRGWVPTPEQGGNGQDSITALELACARKHGIPVLAMMASELWPGGLWDDDKTWIRKFRNDLNLPAAFFDYEAPGREEARGLPAFRAKLQMVLANYKEEQLRKMSPSASDGGLENLDEALEIARARACIPFVGSGIYGQGPLSSHAILEALGDISPPEPSLATVAEYRQDRLRSRAVFLNRLEKLLEEQMRQATVPAVHELLLGSSPPLIVSTTLDLLLEERLNQQGRPPLILCHVIRSSNNQHDGKVLLFRGPGDAHPDISPADTIDLSTAGNTPIIYKPLGSPLLHRQLAGALGIDTVVMTESDHLIFMGRLRAQSIGIPTAISFYFQQYPFLFLGEPTDTWHYRLVVQLFQLIGDSSKRPKSLAVGKPSSPLEKQAWHWLGVDLVELEPNEFAQRLSVSQEARP